MAISHRATGTWTELTADGSVGIPAGASSGDRMYLWASWKDFSITATVSDWTEITEFASGTTSQGNGTGSMKVGCWYKDHDGSETDPTLDFSASPNIAAACILVFQKGGSDTWDTPGFVTGGVSSGAGGAFSDASSTIDVPSGAVVQAIVGIRDDSATFNRHSTNGLTTLEGGVTWNGNYVEAPATHHSTTTNNDMAADVGYRLVTTGASTQTLRVFTTLSANETGSALWVVQGLVTGTTVTPTTASLTTSRFAPTVTVTDNKTATPSTASLTTARFAPTVTASDHKTVTPGALSLTTTTFAPTVRVGVLVVPSTTSLVTTGFAPTVTATNHQTVTPGTASLTTSGFAPTIGIGVRVTPGVASLTLETFSPVVTATGDVPAAPAVQERAVRGRRRIRIIEDPERLEEELLKEEKIVEKDKKKLVVLFKQQAKAEGFLYQQLEQKIEKLEAKVDERMQKIAELIAAMPEIEDDDEEEMFLLS